MDEPQTPGSQSVLLGSVISIKNLLMHLLDSSPSLPAPSRQDFSAIWTILILPFLSPLKAVLEMNQWNLPLHEASQFPVLPFPHFHFT